MPRCCFTGFLHTVTETFRISRLVKRSFNGECTYNGIKTDGVKNAIIPNGKEIRSVLEESSTEDLACVSVSFFDAVVSLPSFFDCSSRIYVIAYRATD